MHNYRLILLGAMQRSFTGDTATESLVALFSDQRRDTCVLCTELSWFLRPRSFASCMALSVSCIASALCCAASTSNSVAHQRFVTWGNVFIRFTLAFTPRSRAESYPVLAGSVCSNESPPKGRSGPSIFGNRKNGSETLSSPNGISVVFTRCTVELWSVQSPQPSRESDLYNDGFGF